MKAWERACRRHHFRHHQWLLLIIVGQLTRMGPELYCALCMLGSGILFFILTVLSVLRIWLLGGRGMRQTETFLVKSASLWNVVEQRSNL
jgi:hypothetical protein